MADILRATRSVPGFSQAAQVSLVEVSPKMREMQTKTLDGVSVTFHDRTGDLPDQPLFLVANEFFDALPIRQFVRAQNQWNERRIGLSNDDLAFGLAPELPQTFLDHRLADTRPGQVVEVCAGAAEVIGPVGARINRHGGAALIIDYGDWRSLGDTLQALRAHQPVDVLADPGHADLTAHVDFEALALACPCPVSRLTPQGVFLERLGLTARAQALAASLSEAALERHIAAHRRLTHPKEMGNLFKVLGVFPSDKAPPPGLQI
jgi:SAM-dependent MidA family methyltransferase